MNYSSIQYFISKMPQIILHTLIKSDIQICFEQKDNLVLMRDIFNFQSPFGFAGQLFDKIILTDYLRAFLIVRNNMIKEFAESDRWRLVLQEKSKGD